MNEPIKQFIARHIVLPLEGMTFGDWWALLRRHHFDVDPSYWFRASVQTVLAVSNSINAGIERKIYGRRIGAASVAPPLFILGHYRSGTTHLHNLLALDPQFAAPTFFQVLNPHTFLSSERLLRPIADRLVVNRRFQDNMVLSSSVASEDEIALGTLTGLSPYFKWYFPKDGSDDSRYLTFKNVSEDEVARWGQALIYFLKKLSIKHRRPLVLKSPPHTARIRMLLHLFPDARFIHIHRSPYDVFQSTTHMIRTVQPVFQLQKSPPLDSPETVLDVYNEMYDAYFEQRHLIPEGRLYDVGFEDLERDPLAVVGSIYKALDLPGLDDVQPRVETYLASIADYRKNQFDDLPETLRSRIAEEWGRSFNEWGYER